MQACWFDSALESAIHICSGQEKGKCTGNSEVYHVLEAFMGNHTASHHKKCIIRRASGLLLSLLDKTERLLLSFCAAKNSRIQIKPLHLTIFRRMENFLKIRWKGLFKIEIAWLSAALKVHSYRQCTSLHHPVSLKTPLLNFRLYFCPPLTRLLHFRS